MMSVDAERCKTYLITVGLKLVKTCVSPNNGCQNRKWNGGIMTTLPGGARGLREKEPGTCCRGRAQRSLSALFHLVLRAIKIPLRFNRIGTPVHVVRIHRAQNDGAISAVFRILAPWNPVCTILARLG